MAIYVANVVKGTQPGTITIDTSCPCCDGTHIDLEAKPYVSGGVCVKCPDTGETIFVRIY